MISFILKVSGVGDFLDEIAHAEDPDDFWRLAHKHRKHDVKQPPKILRRRYILKTINLEGFPLYSHTRGAYSENRIILYLHGGAYTIGPSSLHWSVLDVLQKWTQIDFALLDYPKTPENNAEKSMAVALQAYRHLAEQYKPEQITLMGDSAGGGLALALGMELIACGMTPPRQLVLFSPWLDVSMSHPQARDYDSKDVMLNRKGLIRCGAMYAGDLSVRHPWVSPRFGDLRGLPPVHLFSGGQEVFWPDIHDFATEAQEVGLDVSLTFGEEMPHAYPLFWMMTSGRRALKKVAWILDQGV